MDAMASMMPLLISKYGTKDLQAVISERQEQDTMVFGQYGFKVMMDVPLIRRFPNNAIRPGFPASGSVPSFSRRTIPWDAIFLERSIFRFSLSLIC